MSRAVLIAPPSVLRVGIRTILEQWDPEAKVMEVDNASGFLGVSESLPELDLILADHGALGTEDEGSVVFIRELFPNARILVILHELCRSRIEALYRIGAHGLVPANVACSEFMKALSEIRMAGIYHNTEVHSSLYTRQGIEPNAPSEVHPKFLAATTNRERAFLAELCAPDDPSYGVIAERMGLSLHTVESYRRSLFKKLGVDSRQGLFRAAVNWGLVRL